MKKCAVVAVALTVVSTVASASTFVLDDFTSVTSGGSIAQNVDAGAGCTGPSSATSTGTSIMGGAGSRAMSAARTAGSGCVTVQVDVPSSSDNLQYSSDALAQGFAFVTGQGMAYLISALDTDVSFQANHDLGSTAAASVQTFLHIAGTGAIPGGTYVGAPGVAITNVGPGFSTYTIPLSAFTIGGAIGAGTSIDGYGLIIAGAVSSDIVLDNLQLNGRDQQTPVPEPTTIVLMGGGLAGKLLHRRRQQRS